MMSIDRMATVVLRRRGIGVKERVIRFRGEVIVFRFNNGSYDVYINGVKRYTFATNDINEAVRLLKSGLKTPC